MNAQLNVSDAAQALLAAIQEAEAAGYTVDWPVRPQGLASIAVSETAAVASSEPAVAGVTVEAEAAIGDIAPPTDTDAASAPRPPRK